ncbi:hypothetical protein [Vreelandella venusta]|uniref:hypothetical protein n=1 Tax=Vreelandella venusta TaxID=44935 RepID=UPI00384A8DDC
MQWSNNRGFLLQCRKNIANKKTSEKIEFKIQPDNNQGDKEIIITSEGFSTAYLNDIKNQEKISDFISYTSEQLSPVSLYTPNLLIVVRDPISWIKSTYIQSIKEGNTCSAQEFVTSQKLFIQKSLDLKHITNCYKRFFKNILIMPYEIMKQDEALFWGVISDAFKCSSPNRTPSQESNVSPSPSRVHLMAKLNKKQQYMAIKLLTHKKKAMDSEKIANQYLESGKWLNRRLIEHATEAEIQSIRSEMGISQPPKNWMNFILDNETTHSIEKNYIQFLFDHILPEYPEYYRSKMEQHFLI